MNKVRTLSLAMSSVVLLSCSSVAPVKVVTGEQCFRCRRPIVNERFASETIAGDSRSRFVSKFRGPGCMAKYLVAHPDEKPVVYVTDYASGRMIEPDAAFFVSELVDRNTGETEYRAYRLQADARTAAAELRTTPVTWGAVLANAQ
jgi:hypothetical protein